MTAAHTPVTLAAFGSFTVGGRRVEVTDRPTQVVRLSRDLPEFPVDPNGLYSVGHAYVQYFVPAPAERRPVVLVHGGGLTGTCWETTPDGRPGWLQFLLRAGHPCYVLDNVERGRAGWCPVPGVGEDAAPLLRTEREAWDAFRLGPPEGYPTRTPFAGSRFPGDALAELNRQQVPRWTTTTDLAVAAVTALVRRVGPCAVVAHSQGGGIAARAAAGTDGLVEDLVLVEPHGLPDAADFAGSTGRQLIVAGDFIELSPLYRDLRRRWRTYLEELRTAGVTADYLDLPASDHPGNTHLPMMDLTSDTVAELIVDHLATR
ncbi:alpha/beta fold hydrolase [Actinomycetospora sp. NBRC 106378]|uniref:alpha/beta fold hydrolase n=1 Tax=Actinomycetospora sp. NBRC 106378 TaxID=3032208 RepID=UPI0024A02E29|nr:alpha/beta fold hydrolase [Actinomycetospora sp. NBRC 106378]GLZ55127.1 esterase [Actinomycetospora sp. NBRC 106378]